MRKFLMALLLCLALPAHADNTTTPLGMYQAATCASGSCVFEWDGWERTLNRPPDSMYTIGFINWQGGWEDITGINVQLALDFAWPGRKFVLAVPFFPWGSDIVHAANGDYNVYWAQIARQLVAAGFGDAIIRPAWEFDGGWYPWGFGASGLDETTYDDAFRAAFKRFVNTFRRQEVGDKHFTFVWNPTSAARGVLPSYRQTYPAGTDIFGRDFVDYVGFDCYDSPWDANPDPQARWDTQFAYPLMELAAMSSQHHKPIAFPEWAAGMGGTQVGLPYPNDNPTFVNNMADFIADPTMGSIFPNATMGFNAWWSDDGGPDPVENGAYNGWINDNRFFPQQRAAYIQRFSHP